MLRLNLSPIYIQPNNFADYLSNQQEYCLFLDIDGTLANFTLNPKDSVIPSSTLVLLQKIQSHGVKIAAITGRSLIEAKQMLSPMTLPIAATHGLEIAFDDETDNDGITIDTTELSTIRQAIIDSCTPYNDFIIETKPYSVALHYRQNPTLADVADSIVSTVLDSHADWTVKVGKYVFEIVPKGINKGAAILSLLEKMQTNETSCAIFIGDDVTDEAGFVAIQEGNGAIENAFSPATGMGIKVGTEPTCAHYYVNDISEVTVLLQSFLTFCQTHATLAPDLAAVSPTTNKTARHLI
ncbi:trehalose-phosphatase [Psychrobacter aquaticus]|uniref:trehalose-phosphatase n=1 Tax=Psychrobacter aquaticus TaxID=248452 RepID=UPI001D0D59F5|nr:trehalose-phosphatase [Psychrobacter aquaticus]